MRDDTGNPRSAATTKTGARLFLLGAMLLLLLALVAVPMALAVLFSLPTFIANSEGRPILAGALAGPSLGVAGMFIGATRILKAIPDILRSRQVPLPDPDTDVVGQRGNSG